ncbi:serine/threonine-protein kinase [Actinomyces haliotis]|uniref:serine/threonine-protein kinase n=1 Tax=Actinomyces haliotis TaxID=1280843 RepID=UPI00189032DD|nr:serine/threonine-protein kinase [Actinomyces haliotis]
MTPEEGLRIADRYRLDERLALGGMGEVWRARDLHSGKDVAAKILRPELNGDEIFLSRLRAEAANSRGLRHPNLAVVLDSGEAEGSGWIIMELVQGRALSDVLAERGTLPPAEILPIIAQVARALQVVHTAGVVHRDVKPSNILMTADGVAKLTDFGISTGANQRPMTATGMVMGTAQYLAPEQAMGNMATPSGDLYALGVIAYEALVGHRPFTGATQVDIAFAHVNDPVPELPDSVPPEVRRVVMDLLAKKPVDRPSSAREVARRIDRILVHLEQDSWDPRSPRSWSATGRSVAAAGTGADGVAPPAAGSGREATAGAPSARPAGPVARARRTVHRPARAGRAARPVGRSATAAGTGRAPSTAGAVPGRARSTAWPPAARPTTPSSPAPQQRRAPEPSPAGPAQPVATSRAASSRTGSRIATAPSRAVGAPQPAGVRRRRNLLIALAVVLLVVLVAVVGTLASAHPASSGAAPAPSVIRSEEAL